MVRPRRSTPPPPLTISFRSSVGDGCSLRRDRERRRGRDCGSTIWLNKTSVHRGLSRNSFGRLKSSAVPRSIIEDTNDR